MAETSGSYTGNCTDCILNENEQQSGSGLNECEDCHNSVDRYTDGDDDDDEKDNVGDNVGEKNNDNKESSPGAIVGGTLGGALLICVVIFLFFYAISRFREKFHRQSGKPQHHVLNPAYQTECISIDQIVVEIENKNSDVYEEINEEKQKCPNECRVTSTERDEKDLQAEVEKVGEYNHLNETDKICRDRRGSYDHIKPGPSLSTPPDNYDRALHYGKKNENPEDDQNVTVACDS